MIYCDISEEKQVGFQDPATSIMEGIINLHNYIMYIIIMIILAVLWGLGDILKEIYRNKITYKEIRHGTLIEIIWTIIPGLVLVTIALPSFKLLYLSDEVVDPAITLKVIGKQWYWTYEYSDYDKEKIYDSYMILEDDLKKGEPRLLQVDNEVVLPILTPIRVIVTAYDVMHAWAVPSLGVKMDCIPGRLNQISLLIKREGLYYGQCSELCGTNHMAMPILVKGVGVNEYLSWLQ